jgi:16S rRNA (uracil1498-N3)-methyltransferase
MRLNPGDMIGLFNGRDGEWLARIEDKARAGCTLTPTERIAGQQSEGGPWLAFAPLKKAALDVLIEKATELGVGRLLPLLTRHTQGSRVNVARLAAQAIEAAEQCGRLDVPSVADPVPLAALADAWPAGRPLLLLDETGAGRPLAEVLQAWPADGGTPGFVCGPEGGFAAEELDGLGKLPFAVRVGLGPRILRAETAALAALACWQAWRGDWRYEPAPRDGRR